MTTNQKMAHRIAQRYMQANQTDLQWGITQLEAAQGILKEVSDVWSLRGGGQPSVLDEYPAADAAVTAFRGQVSRNLSKHLQALKRIRTAARLTDWSNPRSIQVFLGILTRKTRTFDDQDVQDGSVDMRRKQASAVISKEVWNPREPGEYDTVDFIVVLAWGKGEIILLDGDSYRPLGKVPFMFMADADPSKVALLVDKLVKAKAPKPNFGYSSPSLGDTAPNEHFTERNAVLGKRAREAAVSGEAQIKGNLKVKKGSVSINLDQVSGLELSIYRGSGSYGAEAVSELAYILDGAKVSGAYPYGNGKITLMLQPSSQGRQRIQAHKKAAQKVLSEGMGLRHDLVKLAKEKPELRKVVVGLLRSSQRNQYVVVDEKTLGVVMGHSIQVLATKASHVDSPGTMPVPMDKNRMRPATPEDFKKFRVMVPPELRKTMVGLLRSASSDGYYILSALIPDKDLLALHTRLAKDGPDGDKQSADLLMDVRAKIAKELEISRGASEALSRLRDVATRGKNWDTALIRNNIFKAANSLGMRLPSHMFASETREADFNWKGVAKKLLDQNTGMTQRDLHYRAYLRAIVSGQPAEHLVKKFPGAEEARSDLIDEAGKGKLGHL